MGLYVKKAQVLAPGGHPFSMDFWKWLERNCAVETKTPPSSWVSCQLAHFKLLHFVKVLCILQPPCCKGGNLRRKLPSGPAWNERSFPALISASWLEQGPAGAFRVQELGLPPGLRDVQHDCSTFLTCLTCLAQPPCRLGVSVPCSCPDLQMSSLKHSLSTSFALQVSATGRDLPSFNNTHSLHELWCQIWDRLWGMVTPHPCLLLSLKWTLYKRISPSKKRKGYCKDEKMFPLLYSSAKVGALGKKIGMPEKLRSSVLANTRKKDLQYITRHLPSQPLRK